MRTYILTDRERTFIKAFLDNQAVLHADYGTYCQLRHQFRKNKEILNKDLALLERFIATIRTPRCFGSDDVKKIHGRDGNKKCLKCDAQGKCLIENTRNSGLIP